MLVADASSSLAWFLENPPSAATRRVLNLARRSLLIVPPLWILETQNALLKLVRQRKLAMAEAMEIKLELDLISKRIVTAQDATHRDRVWDIACAHMMTTYDACYVELAWRLGLPIASQDAAMHAAARALKIRVL